MFRIGQAITAQPGHHGDGSLGTPSRVMRFFPTNKAFDAKSIIDVNGPIIYKTASSNKPSGTRSSTG